MNQKRRKERFTEAFGAKAAWIRTLPCFVHADADSFLPMGHVVVYSCIGATQAMHTKSRGAGGASKHLIPACALHHSEQHLLGILSFAAKYNVNLNELAERYEALYRASLHNADTESFVSQ